MRRRFLSLIPLLALVPAISVASPLLKQFGDTGSDDGTDVAVDAGGNLLVAGMFNGTVNFGGGPLVSSTGNGDIYLAKYDASGSHIWSKALGSGGLDYPYKITTDASGNLLVTGPITKSVDLGGGPLISAGAQDIFLAKFSSTGAHVWSQRFGAGDNDVGIGVAVDASGNVVVTGRFQGTVNFGGGNLTSAGNTDVFMAKFNPAGVHLWSKSFGSFEADEGLAVAVDGSGNIVLAGDFSQTVNFGGSNLTAAGAYDAVLAKYDTDGNHLWSFRVGGVSADVFYDADFDPAGDIVVAALFVQAADFGAGPVTSAGGSDIAVVKYSADGSHVWSRTYGAAGNDAPQAVDIDANGNALVSGYFIGFKIDFGGHQLHNHGGADIFLVSLNTNGSLRWSRGWGGTGNDYGGGCAWSAGEPLLTGRFEQTVDFDGTTLVDPYTTSDAFVLRTASNPVPAMGWPGAVALASLTALAGVVVLYRSRRKDPRGMLA